MVLHLGGCGRVGHRHNTRNKGWGPEHNRSRPHPFTYTHMKTEKGTAREACKTILGVGPFLLTHLLLQPARVNTCTVVRYHHAYGRNTVTIERARAWRVIAPPARKHRHTHPIHPPAHSALLCSSLALDAFLSGILSGLLCHARSAWLLGVRGVY